MGMLHEDVTARIVKVYYDVYNELGHGFLERVCQTAMVMALTEAGLSVVQNVALAVWFRGVCIGEFVPDMVVDGKVIVEIKSASALHPWNDAQILNYLRVSSLEVGLLMNFGPKAEYRRKILTNDRKTAQNVTLSVQIQSVKSVRSVAKKIWISAIRGSTRELLQLR